MKRLWSIWRTIRIKCKYIKVIDIVVFIVIGLFVIFTPALYLINNAFVELGTGINFPGIAKKVVAINDIELSVEEYDYLFCAECDYYFPCLSSSADKQDFVVKNDKTDFINNAVYNKIQSIQSFNYEPYQSDIISAQNNFEQRMIALSKKNNLLPSKYYQLIYGKNIKGFNSIKDMVGKYEVYSQIQSKKLESQYNALSEKDYQSSKHLLDVVNIQECHVSYTSENISEKEKLATRIFRSIRANGNFVTVAASEKLDLQEHTHLDISYYLEYKEIYNWLIGAEPDSVALFKTDTDFIIIRLGERFTNDKKTYNFKVYEIDKAAFDKVIESNVRPSMELFNYQCYENIIPSYLFNIAEVKNFEQNSPDKGDCCFFSCYNKYYACEIESEGVELWKYRIMVESLS